MSRETNINAFQDTCAKISTNEELQKSVFYSKQYMQVIPESKSINILSLETPKRGLIKVSNSRTFDAARTYESGHTAVLNFASATTAGGGVVKGAQAQEECLCRCSTLYQILSNKKCWDEFYKPHRDNLNPLHNDDIIWVPKCKVFKNDDLQLLPQNEWKDVSVITCAAPNLRQKNCDMFNIDKAIDYELSNDELYKIHLKRAIRIFTVAAQKKVDNIIVGAFGCGAFKNDPTTVAKAWKEASEAYKQFFDTIEFAVYDPMKFNVSWTNNYKIFSEII